jgi:hypothetical protein
VHADSVPNEAIGLSARRLNAFRRKICGNGSAQAALIQRIGDRARVAVGMEGAGPAKGVAL